MVKWLIVKPDDCPFKFFKIFGYFLKKLSLIGYFSFIIGEESPSSLLVNFISHQNTNGEYPSN